MSAIAFFIAVCEFILKLSPGLLPGSNMDYRGGRDGSWVEYEMEGTQELVGISAFLDDDAGIIFKPSPRTLLCNTRTKPPSLLNEDHKWATDATTEAPP